MRHLLTNLGLVTTMTLGVAAFGSVVVTAPAFNAELRRTGAFGSSILPLGAPMYDPASYLYQQAATFVRADLLPFGDGESAPLIAPLELSEQRAAEAVALARESLALDPGNAGAWAVLAWAHMMVAETDEARVAINRSWELAPHSLSLSSERLALVLALFDPILYAENPPSPTEAEQAAYFRDLETLWVQRRGQFRNYAEEARLAGLPVPEFQTSD